MKLIQTILLFCTLILPLVVKAEKITIAAASDLKFAMDEIVTAFKQTHPYDEVDVVYGSSGKFHTQIQQGAPYDLYFSADIKYAQSLASAGLAVSDVKAYAFGRIVLWSASLDASKMTLDSLLDLTISRIAIANPRHAPYGMRAVEALKASGLWDKLEPKLVYGENIAHTAQFVQTGNAQIGIVALALAVNPELSSKGDYYLIPDTLHTPLEQGFIITKLAEGKPAVRQFANYMSSQPARAVMIHYGFVLPDEVAGN
ncbi:MAG: molybdate ABC transporter substrate-binding protein [Gammaproteobacteria bacterium]|nr:molybdate ABC transporter substrate-binding protein [Gammaproteobacteria bacterium]